MLSHECWDACPQAPWGLAVTEVTTLLLLYFVAVPSAVIVRQPLARYHYAFDRSLEDVVALSLARGLAVTIAYFSGAGAKHHRCAACLNRWASDFAMQTPQTATL